MAVPVNVGQPSVAMPYSLVTQGLYPNFSGNPLGWGSAASLGFIITTAFDYDPSNLRELLPVSGQTLSVASSTELFSLLGDTYGGNAWTSFGLPDLQGIAPIYATFPDNGSTRWGQQIGNPGNAVSLEQIQMPSALGGISQPVSITQEGLGIQYLIQTQGLFPSGSSPTTDTLGMVYPYASPARGGVPDGFLPADGRLLSVADFQALFAVLGTTYGGDGVNTFGLPDLRNRMPVGTGVSASGQSIDLGEAFGTSYEQLSPTEVAGTSAMQTTAPSLGMHYVINTQGIYWALEEGESMIGQITLYAGQYMPENWTLAQGQVVPVANNQALFSLLGTNFGGDGVRTFALPDLRGRTVIGTGGENNLQVGDVQGSFSQFLTLENLPEIFTPTPGVQVLDENGQIAGDKITGKFELDLTGVWPQARVEYSTDGITWSETYTAQEGSNTLYVRQVNVLGQASAATQPITFVLDTTAPEAPQVVIDGVALAAPMFKAAVPVEDETVPRTSTGNLSFVGVEDEAQVEFSTDGGQTWTDSFEAQTGLNAVQVRQIDRAGNISPVSDLVQFYWDGSDADPALTSITADPAGGNAITVEQPGALALGLGTGSIDVLIYGYQRNVGLPEDIEHIRLVENGLNNTITGNASDNVFEIVVGNWVIEAAEGEDTVMLANPIADYSITQESYNGDLQATLYGPEGRVIVRGVERIIFSDAELIKVDDQTTTGVAYQALDHLYEDVLGRDPDVQGLTYWVEQMSQGATLQDVAQAISQSAEFKQLYGSPSDEQLVEEMYEAILDRAPDREGLSYWVQELVVNQITEGNLIASLLLSPESQASISHASSGGLFVVG